MSGKFKGIIHPKIYSISCHSKPVRSSVEHIKCLESDSLSHHSISLLFNPIKMHADSTVVLPYTSFDVPQKIKSQGWKNVKDINKWWKIEVNSFFKSVYICHLLMVQESQSFDPSQNKVLCYFCTKTPETNKKYPWSPKSENVKHICMSLIMLHYIAYYLCHLV